MKPIKGSFSEKIVQTLKVDYKSPEFHEIFELSLRYVSKCIGYGKYHQELKKHVNFSELDGYTPAKFRLLIREDGYLLTSIKFYAMYLSCHPVTKELAEETYPSYKMFRCDARAVFSCFARRGFKSQFRRESDFEWVKSDVTPSALAQAQDSFINFVPEVKKFCSMQMRKIQFISSSNNFSRTEFESELLMSGLRSYYYLIPTEHEGEKLLNYLRASMSNANKNIIDKFTSVKRGRLVNEGEDASGNAHYNLRVVSQSQLHQFDEDGEVQYDSIFSESHVKLHSAEEFEFSVKQVIAKKIKSSLTDSKRQAELLAIFMGYPNKKFDAYLHSKRLIRSEKCSSEFIDNNSREDYIPVLSNYLGVSERCLNLYLAKIGRELGYSI